MGDAESGDAGTAGAGRNGNWIVALVGGWASGLERLARRIGAAEVSGFRTRMREGALWHALPLAAGCVGLAFALHELRFHAPPAAAALVTLVSIAVGAGFVHGRSRHRVLLRLKTAAGQARASAQRADHADRRDVAELRLRVRRRMMLVALGGVLVPAAAALIAEPWRNAIVEGFALPDALAQGLIAAPIALGIAAGAAAVGTAVRCKRDGVGAMPHDGAAPPVLTAFVAGAQGAIVPTRENRNSAGVRTAVAAAGLFAGALVCERVLFDAPPGLNGSAATGPVSTSSLASALGTRDVLWLDATRPWEIDLSSRPAGVIALAPPAVDSTWTPALRQRLLRRCLSRLLPGGRLVFAGHNSKWCEAAAAIVCQPTNFTATARSDASLPAPLAPCRMTAITPAEAVPLMVSGPNREAWVRTLAWPAGTRIEVDEPSASAAYASSAARVLICNGR